MNVNETFDTETIMNSILDTETIIVDALLVFQHSHANNDGKEKEISIGDVVLVKFLHKPEFVFIGLIVSRDPLIAYIYPLEGCCKVLEGEILGRLINTENLTCKLNPFEYGTPEYDKEIDKFVDAQREVYELIRKKEAEDREKTVINKKKQIH